MTAINVLPDWNCLSGEQCREQRKRCKRTWHSKSCERCINRKIGCSFKEEESIAKFENVEELETILNILKSVDLLEHDIKVSENQLLQAQSRQQQQLQLRTTLSNNRALSTDSNWELTIQSSKGQRMSLQIKLERTAGTNSIVLRCYDCLQTAL